MKNGIRRFKLSSQETALLVVDVQERLAAAMEDRSTVVRNIEHIAVLAADQEIPVLITEQYPKGLGRTVPELHDSLPLSAIEKITFSCCGEPAFTKALRELGRDKIIVVGMETHVCVLQTVLDLLEEGFTVHVVADAVSSRTRENRDRGLAFLESAGAIVTVTETVLFQLLTQAGTDIFKKISKRIK